MPRPKGSPNKITSEVKEKLQLLIDDLIASLNVNELDANQRIKMLQIALQYTLPRMKQANYICCSCCSSYCVLYF